MPKNKEVKKIVFNSEKDMPLAPMSIGTMLHNKTGAWRNIKPVIELSKCIKCGICWKFCPDTSIDIVDDWPVINYDYCKGCGICAEECPEKCIEMVEEER